MGVFQNNLMGAAAAAASAGGGGFYSHQIANSCRFNQSASAHMYRTQGTPTNVDKCTISAWVKRGILGTASNFTGAGKSSGTYCYIGFDTANEFYYLQDTGPTQAPWYESNSLYRDPSAWYHIVIAQDSTQSAAADRNKIYINGVQYTDWGDHNVDSVLNADFAMNTSGYNIFVGSGGNSAGAVYQPFDGLVAEYCFIDGTQYDVTDFGESKNGAWIPKDPSGLTFGNNGCYLKFESSSDLGNDSSGNNNDFTLSAVSAHDQMLDSPTFSSTDGNGGNFMTYNGAWLGTGGNVLSEGNLASSGSGGGTNSGTFGMLTGKWYWECRASTVASYGPTFGIGQSGEGQGTNGQNYTITWQTAAGVMFSGGAPVEMGTITVTSTGVTTLSSGDILSFWLDCDNRKLWVGKNGTIPNSGAPASGTNPQASWTTNPTSRYFTAICENVSSVGVLNAGQESTFGGAITAGTNTDKNGYGLFQYDPSATDFIACCSGNLPTADAVDPAQTDDDYPQKLFNTKLYTGTGSSNALTGVGFQPDWTWIKETGGINDHKLTDSTRGVTKSIESNETDAEATDSNGLTAFGTDGFTVGSDAVYNNSSDTYVSWNWRANGGTTSSNGNGSITSTVQVDPSGGFSIVNYTGYDSTWDNLSTVGHGLSAAPNCILSKTVDADQWEVYHSAVGAGGGSNASYNSLRLDGTGALYTNQTYKTWGGVMPTSTVYTVNGNNANKAGTVQRAYCFANTEGYIKTGSYIGNGNVDGPYVYTGFSPNFVIIKNIARASDWRSFDIANDPYNYAIHYLAPNTSAAMNTTDNPSGLPNIDILSNGFKIRGTSSTTLNYSSDGYIYIAMAHNPFQYATAR